jgi:hypothetical protein
LLSDRLAHPRSCGGYGAVYGAFAFSKHLTVLDCVGLVDGEKSGREMRYRLNVERLDRATRSLGELAAAWDQRLMRIKQIAETAAAKQPKK